MDASSSGGSASPSDVALQDDAFLAGPKLKLNTFDGVRLWLEGVAYLGRHPLLFLRCVPFAAATLASCLWVSACIWVCALPLRLVGVRVGLDGLLRTTAVSTLQLTQVLRPATSGGAFFSALERRAPELCAALRARPTIRGWAPRARLLLLEVFVGCCVVYALVVFSAAWAPVLAAVAATVASGAVAAFPLAPVLVLTLATGAAGVALFALWTPLVRPALKFVAAVAEFSRPLAALAALLVLTGCVKAPTVELCANAAWVYVLTFVQSKQFLFQFDARMSADRWAAFCADHRWALFGFGLPSWAVTHFGHPCLGLLLLDANQAAAAVFLAEALRPPPPGRRPKLH